VALRARNSGTESDRELFKGSKDSASLLVCTRKKLFWLGDLKTSKIEDSKLQTRRLAESLEGLNSSLVQSAEELWTCITSANSLIFV